jgi:hypothetical protein
MIRRPKVFSFLCWLCVILGFSTCTYEMALAQVGGDASPADTAAVRTDGRPAQESQVVSGSRLFPFNLQGDIPGDDQLGSQPIHRKWWFLAVGAVLVTTAVMLITGGKEEKAKEEDLPGFPEPPAR